MVLNDFYIYDIYVKE